MNEGIHEETDTDRKSEALITPPAAHDGGPMERVARLDELIEGQIKLARAGTTRIIIIRRGDRVFALAAYCTHARILLAPGRLDPDGLIECPAHGAKFSATDGSVRCAPAQLPLATYRTRIVAGEVFVDPVAEITTPATDRAPVSAWAKWT